MVYGGCMKLDYSRGENAPALVALCSNCSREECAGICKDYVSKFREVFGLRPIYRSKNHMAIPHVNRNRKSYKTLLNQKGKLYEAFGQAHSLSEWAEIYGLKYMTLYQRLRSGYSFEEALTMSHRYEDRVTIGDVSLTVWEWSKKNGIRYSTIAKRISNGWAVEKAVSIPPLRDQKSWSRKAGAHYDENIDLDGI